MKMRVLILVDGTAHFGKGIETVLAHLGAADAVVDGSDDRVGRMEIGIPWAAGHIARNNSSGDKKLGLKPEAQTN